MTFDVLRKLFYDTKTTFFNSVDDNYLEIVIDLLVEKTYGIFQSAESKSIDTAKNVANFIEAYSTCFDPKKIDVVSMHLFLMTIFNELEQIASNDHNDKLQVIWSKMGDLIVEASLNINEYENK